MINYKTASKDELLAHFKKLFIETGDIPIGVKKELLNLPQILNDDEIVISLLRGSVERYSYLVTLTNERIIFLQNNLSSKIIQFFIYLEDITKIAGSTGWMLGDIMIGTSNQDYVISSVMKSIVVPFTNSVNTARKDKKNNTIYNLNDNKPQQQQQQQQQQQTISTDNNDYIDKLERLAALKEKGILSDEEFLLTKSKILNSI